MDPGVDDAIAIALALRCPAAEVVALTTVCGNCSLDDATQNAALVTQLLASQEPIPVHAGASGPLRDGPRYSATSVHGPDGLGGCRQAYLAERPLLRQPSPPSDHALVEALRRYAPVDTLIATGPLTNLALALSQDPGAFDGVRTVIMGGAFGAPGNMTPTAEFNVYADPEAAAQVMASGLPQTWVPLNVTEGVVLPESLLQHWAERHPGPLSRFLLDCTPCYLDFHRRQGIEGIQVHDALAVAAVLWPEFLRFATLSAAVETEGRWTRGQTVADLRQGVRPWAGAAQVSVALEVDAKPLLLRFEGTVFGG
jgi:inosine-uridine nucleoside N-ribohydrolase